MPSIYAVFVIFPVALSFILALNINVCALVVSEVPAGTLTFHVTFPFDKFVFQIHIKFSNDPFNKEKRNGKH